MGSLATGATYFGVIESTKKWMDESYPGIGGHWAHFISGAIGHFFSLKNEHDYGISDHFCNFYVLPNSLMRPCLE